MNYENRGAGHGEAAATTSDNGLPIDDAQAQGAQGGTNRLSAHGQILTGADFAEPGKPGERLDLFFEQLADRFSDSVAVVSEPVPKRVERFQWVMIQSDF